ncbi:acyl-CoA/acyl-ACP dehydrogenase [Defluviimonas sp. WL0024]|uniref:Medium-chain specific acyl-CoA dehydrogenase, mitochondrial n=1 Tax=Albidovulum salinarum TaxID=2984153 RepID=A0ABT2X9H4_9RHOB|nr:acyl-CoA dehydrogenase family protein [Defluviimonas sp. WL0024]MCU9850589.1 acyl-CoA/acyl-ACP dehydrogenase [Defluviimonas sp. WL0024]
MDFALTEEQRLLSDTVREFCEHELIPHEEILEKTNELPRDLELEIRRKGMELGLHACNMPESVGGAGLDCVSFTLVEKGLSRASLALAECVRRPNNILAACEGEQIAHFLQPVMRGEKRECVAMTEPEAGSDLKGMKTRAVRDGGDWVINGTKHFISNAEISDFVILFAATGEDETPKGPRKRISCFLVDLDAAGVEVANGYDHMGHRGYYNNILRFDDVRVGDWQMVGGEGEGFKVVSDWLGPGRLTVAAVCQARAERAFEVALDYAATRKQFGEVIGKFQGISFPLADMATDIRLGDLLLMNTAWKVDRNAPTVAEDCAMAKVWCSEMLGRVADQAIQTCGGMGVMSDLPLERIYRDARVERLWEGTSEIQRHIISRQLLRPLGA